MIRIRPERQGDRRPIHDLLVDAFTDDVPARLVAGLRVAPGPAPALALVAEDQDAVVGFVMLTAVEVQGASTFEALNLSPLAVAPRHQGRGIARALVEAGLRGADAAGRYPFVVLEGDPTHYHRYGFTRASLAGIERPSPRIPDDAFLYHPLGAYEPTLHRGVVRYPTIFHTLGAIGP